VNIITIEPAIELSSDPAVELRWLALPEI